MKKFLLSITMALAATTTNAQLVVDSIGHVGLATDSTQSMLSVGMSGGSNVAMQCSARGRSMGLYILNQTNSIHQTDGSYFRVQNNNGRCYGGRSLALGNNNQESLQYVIGMAGYGGMARTAVGLFGGKDMGSSVNFAGVYGAETFGDVPTFTNYSGTYAGYFRGKVRVTNGIYATVLSPTASISPSGQGATALSSEKGESVTDKLFNVQAVQFQRYDPTQVSNNTTRTNLKDISIDNMSLEELDSLRDTLPEEEPERYLSPIQYGLDAGQLKAVYPELVYEDANGNVSINYVEMVPLLVQSINELKAELAELKGSSAKKAKAKAETTGIKESVSDIDIVRMDQNKPNPFSESTVISLNIPRETQSATIFIYDMSGKQVQSLPVSERGETDITIYASSLSAGMYIYTLVVDGKVKVTRRMIITE